MSTPAKELVINGHLYVFAPLAYDDAVMVSAELMGGVLPPLGALLTGPLGAAMEGAISLEDLMGSDVAHVLRDVDVVEVCKEMGAAMRRGDIQPGMVRKALASTTRDGVQLAGEAFDQAFRGRLNESFLACFHAISANGLFSLPSTSVPRAQGQGAAQQGGPKSLAQPGSESTGSAGGS